VQSDKVIGAAIALHNRTLLDEGEIREMREFEKLMEHVQTYVLTEFAVEIHES